MSTAPINIGLSILRGRSGRPSALLDAEHSSTSSPQGTVHEESFGVIHLRAHREEAWCNFTPHPIDEWRR